VPDRDAPEPKVVVVELPAANDTDIVGGILRPPRPLTVGRRKSDRWMARAMAAAFTLLIGFVIYITVLMADLAEAIQSCRR
jgi:hypothetical protein